MLAAKPQFGRGEQPIDDHVAAADTVVDQLRSAFVADDPERRHLALGDAARELDKHLTAVVIRPQRPPGGRVALDPVAEVQRVEIDPARHRLRGLCGRVLAAQRD